jgi:hypothetical protein
MNSTTLPELLPAETLRLDNPAIQLSPRQYPHLADTFSLISPAALLPVKHAYVIFTATHSRLSGDWRNKRDWMRCDQSNESINFRWEGILLDLPQLDNRNRLAMFISVRAATQLSVGFFPGYHTDAITLRGVQILQHEIGPNLRIPDWGTADIPAMVANCLNSSDRVYHARSPKFALKQHVPIPLIDYHTKTITNNVWSPTPRTSCGFSFLRICDRHFFTPKVINGRIDYLTHSQFLNRYGQARGYKMYNPTHGPVELAQIPR